MTSSSGPAESRAQPSADEPRLVLVRQGDRQRATRELERLEMAAKVAGVLTAVIEDEDIENWVDIERGVELVRRAWLGELGGLTPTW